jgi:hypothetical protein
VHVQNGQLLAPPRRELGRRVPRSAGEIATASVRAGFKDVGRTITLSPIVPPFDFVRFSRTTKLPQRASIRCTTHGSGGHEYRAWPEKNAQSMPTTMPAAATRATKAARPTAATSEPDAVPGGHRTRRHRLPPSVRGQRPVRPVMVPARSPKLRSSAARSLPKRLLRCSTLTTSATDGPAIVGLEGAGTAFRSSSLSRSTGMLLHLPSSITIAPQGPSCFIGEGAERDPRTTTDRASPGAEPRFTGVGRAIPYLAEPPGSAGSLMPPEGRWACLRHLGREVIFRAHTDADQGGAPGTIALTPFGITYGAGRTASSRGALGQERAPAQDSRRCMGSRDRRTDGTLGRR